VESRSRLTKRVGPVPLTPFTSDPCECLIVHSCRSRYPVPRGRDVLLVAAASHARIGEQRPGVGASPLLVPDRGALSTGGARCPAGLKRRFASCSTTVTDGGRLVGATMRSVGATMRSCPCCLGWGCASARWGGVPDYPSFGGATPPVGEIRSHGVRPHTRMIEVRFSP
jgi:hypothetical protein